MVYECDAIRVMRAILYTVSSSSMVYSYIFE
jgi:hypothetical protein